MQAVFKKKKAAMALGIADATLQIPKVLISGEGRKTEPQTVCKIREGRRGTL